mgnify:CR=1 FL=1|jgi:diadenosine tetraphosphate (Ap4A) HIT family hydrolase|tara:strand:+ start:705 stop:1106 length:402 start_codon:yes stop_codon:yes gene_type:complete
MTSKKPIYKKPFEPIDNYKESTWVGNSTPIFEDEHTAVFKDRYPCVDGHLLFIAKKNTAEYVGRSYGLAFQWGQDRIKEGKMDGFNVGQNIGKCAGQTIYWPHIHFIPRKDGDSKKPGGIRHAHLGVIHKHHY